MVNHISALKNRDSKDEPDCHGNVSVLNRVRKSANSLRLSSVRESFHHAAHKAIVLYEKLCVELQATYSEDRLKELMEFDENCKRNSFKSVCWIISILVMIPVLSLAGLCLLNYIKLDPPFEDPESDHSAFKIRSTAEVFMAATEIVVMLHAQLPGLKLGLIGIILPSMTYAALFYFQLGQLPILLQYLTSSAHAWYPLPFAIHVTAPLCWVFTATVTVLLVRNPIIKRFQTYVHIEDGWQRLKKYVILETTQFMLIMIYTSYGVLVRNVSEEVKPYLTLLLPIMKLGGKNIITHFSEEYSEDLAPILTVFTAELFNAIYISFALQESKSSLVIAAVIGFDFALNLWHMRDIHRYSSGLATLPETKAEARKRRSSMASGHRVGSVASFSAIATRTGSKVSPVPTTTANTLDAMNTRKMNVKLRSRIMYMTEHIVLTEYVEVIIPIIYGCYVYFMYHNPNKEYIVGLRSSEFSEADLENTMSSLKIFAICELVSFMLLYLIVSNVMKTNVLYQLGYVMQKHFFLALVAPTMWLIVTNAFNLDHHGCDFSFQFKWLQQNT